MKKIMFRVMIFVFATALISCSSDDGEEDSDTGDMLVGQDGNPRFNLQFTNPDNVDLDLYVKTPNDIIISYSNSFADGGNLDVDCLCGICPQGPNENIFWEDGTAPEGVYEYWVEYYGSCDGSDPSSNFTLRVVQNEQILATHTGTLNGGMSSVYTHNQ